MATTSFTRGVSVPRATEVNVAVGRLGGGRRGVYDAASDDPVRVQESHVSTDQPSGDPRAFLVRAIGSVARNGDLDSILAGIMASATEALTPSMGAIFVQDPDHPGLHLVAALGMDEASLGRLVTDVADPGHPFRVAATSREATFDREATTPDGATFIGAYLPLLVSSGGVDLSLGSIGFGWPAPRVLDDAERATIAALSWLAAVAIDRQRLGSTAAERSEWFERMAHTDLLTGLANERTVGRILELELARAGRQGSEVTLAMFDVDDFRTTNREGGSEAGDDVLRRVAAVLAESVRLVDTVGRVGGDEFVLVAPGSAGAVVAQRVIDGIAALPPVGGRVVSVSAGVARFPVDGADAQALIGAATEGLARARDAGRGSVGVGAAAEG
jgi:diguanylate cyclase (GGDEF)-like protein